jgi:acetyl-CoA acetyltransferase
VSEPIYLAGVAESPLGEVRDQTELSMVALAAREALAEAGMTLRDVDALFVNYMGEEGSVQVAEYLGIEPRYSDSTDLGGAAFEAFVHHAMVAVAAGRCEVALIAYASRQRTRRGRTNSFAGDSTSLWNQFDQPAGLPAPIGHYGLIAARHAHAFGTTEAQLAEIAVAARQWASRNPKAFVREPLSIAQVLESRKLADPLKKLDCCLVTDGGGALVVTTAARARDAAKQPIRILGAGESHTHWHLAQMPDLTVTAGARAAQEAFAMAGIGPSEVDVLQPYDSFTITVLMALEDLGFCPKGEGGRFVEGGRLGPGGALPSMTSGGGLSYCHPGALGLLLLVESVRQLRGEAGERQVPNARIGVAHGVGGFMSTASTVVLARE